LEVKEGEEGLKRKKKSACYQEGRAIGDHNLHWVAQLAGSRKKHKRKKKTQDHFGGRGRVR